MMYATRRPSGLSMSQCLLVSALVILTVLTTISAQSLPRSSSSRRRTASKSAVEEVSEKSTVPDQLALAAGRADGRGYHRRASTSRPKETSNDYSYGQLEMNLIRPENELPQRHSKISAHYSNSLSTTAAAGTASQETAALEDSETAAEYVANAVKLAYGSRQNFVTEQPYSQEQQKIAQQPQQQQQQQQQSTPTALASPDSVQQQQEAQAQALLEAQIQAELQAQLAQQALLLSEQQQQQAAPTVNEPAPVYERDPGITRSYDVYEPNASQAENSDIERQYRAKYYYQQQQTQYPYRSIEQEAEEKVRLSASTEIPKAEIMKQIEKSVIKYMKELQAEGKIITTHQEPSSKTYYYKQLGTTGPAQSEEKRYSSTTVRPKYNAGSSSATSSSSGYHASSANVAPRYQTQAASHMQQHHQAHSKPQQQQSHTGLKAHPPPRYQSETETAYQAPELSPDEMAPNVEFIYKIKTRAPLQTATVKTVSKPYTLPLKSGAHAEHFDHGAALKNIEEFDLSHVVTTPEQDERALSASVTTKPHKLYFNSDIYHDINSLPYKADKLRGAGSGAALEYRHKHKQNAELHADYKGYTGYFAEPAPSSIEQDEKQPPNDAEGGSNDGYPLINPYQYVVKKPQLPSKYEESSDNWGEQPLRLSHAKPGVYKSGSGAGSSLEYDSYSPKFNNNPEGYGYQHTYKTQLLRGSGPGSSSNAGNGKRGKRGGGSTHQAISTSGKKNVVRVGAGKLVKNIEADLALRPPPKN